jgi:tryptophanyl-tRNA synthetase
VADLLALGLDEKNAYIYRQSQELDVLRLAQLFAKKVTTNMMRAIYGEREIGLYNAALIQAGDITLPQTEKFGGPKQVLVPVGVDQDPHMRLVRDITQKLSSELLLPASTYHKFFRNLEGESKMSKRKEGAVLTLGDSPAEVKRKVMNALTGGRDTAEEQRKLGGRPDICVIFELAKYHFETDDGKLAQRRKRCEGGSMLCGECKAEVLKQILGFFEKHEAKKKKMLPKAKKLVG